jgi:hypothetical protein
MWIGGNMYLTTKEARKKICPLSFTGKAPADCWAQGCMLWRWEYDDETKDTDKGCCGLAPMEINANIQEFPTIIPRHL